MLSSTNFDLMNIQKDKTALLIISNNKLVSKRLIPLIIEECIMHLHLQMIKLVD